MSWIHLGYTYLYIVYIYHSGNFSVSHACNMQSETVASLFISFFYARCWQLMACGADLIPGAGGL